ncbi:MAG TPA: hypothetical protein VIF57_10500 [Polyangia bacterium]|jgi:hypothetical protein
MPAHAKFSSYARRAADRAVGRAYAELAPAARGAFAELVLAVRTRSTARIDPPIVAALRNLARHAAGTLRPLDEWAGARGTMYPVIHSLARHLLARYGVPRFLASVWYGDAGWSADAKRRWYIAHAAGVPFRDLDLPIAMTRRMESIFLGAPDHLRWRRRCAAPSCSPSGPRTISWRRCWRRGWAPSWRTRRSGGR